MSDQEQGLGNPDDDNDPQFSLQEWISSERPPIHTVFLFLIPLLLIPLLLTAVQVQFQGKEQSPFEARPKTMWAFLLVTVIYAFAFVANVKFPNKSWSRFAALAILLTGSFSSTALISVLLPSFGGLIILIIWGFIPLMIARHRIALICSCIYNRMKVGIFKICSGFLRDNSMEEDLPK